MKERFSVSLEDAVIKSVASLSSKTGLTKSYICSKWILEGLKSDLRLSTSERYFFSKKIVLMEIENLFRCVGLEYKSIDISKSVVILFSIPDNVFASKTEADKYKLSLVLLLDKIKVHDRNIYQETLDILNKLRMKISISSEISEDFDASEGEKCVTDIVV